MLQMHLMHALTFCLVQKCIWCENAFWHANNVRKRQNAFWRTFSKGKCSAVQKCIWCKNAFDAKMHLMHASKVAKCIWLPQMQIFCNAVHFPKENVQLCKNAFLHHILRSKMFSITFDFVKCSASHFPKENVQQTNVTNAFDAKNAFLHAKC